jgi:imidazolonepropionase
MPILVNISTLASCTGPGQSDIGLIEDAAVVWSGETIEWVGKEADLPAEYADEEPIDAGGRLVIPGLVDCHTHLAFGGWRADEFELRSRGASYLEIAKAGGGIASTVGHTREISEDDLFERAQGFLSEMLRLGVTTVEAKSGYGLDLESELKTLRVYRRLREHFPGTLVSTFLGAHIVPPEFKDDREAYIRLLIEEMIPAVAHEKLAEFCDVFVEDTAFSIDEARRILEAGKQHGLRPKLHADQLSDGGGAALAAEVGAASADHLEYTSDVGIEAMAEVGVVAVSLPIATLYLRQPPMDARRFIERGVPVAVATDFNPGSAPSFHLPFAMTLACTMQRMTPAEALKGATLFAARAIGLEDRVGSIEPGKRTHLVLLDAESVNDWLYHLRPNAVSQVIVGGRIMPPNH